ncbi:UNKNOWN [Stylonychia lemnae]|uniref:HMG box domain-containing protein n=1 Tax=Stylonychia lemnae TaxID=5949 RepID=A0A078AVF8_STYLE|nr:UNKNOWN [Stylonychia lemnae]|eukprot:CDW84813.1 UNKNOWN [Stylonychia lemnae]
MDKGKKQVKAVEGGKTSERKPRSVSKKDDKKKAGSKSKSNTRASKSPMGKKSDAKAKGKKSASTDVKKKEQTASEVKDKKKGKGKKDEASEPEEEKLKPTRAISSYIYFSNEMVPKIKKDDGLSHKEAMSKAGELWGKLSADDKKPFDKLHDDDVKRQILSLTYLILRYEKQLKELQTKGYFIMADGTKSSDHAVVGKKKRGQRSEKKEAKKRSSAVNKSMRSEKSGEKGKKGAAKGKSKKSDDDLDIESDSESENASQPQESD